MVVYSVDQVGQDRLMSGSHSCGLNAAFGKWGLGFVNRPFS